MTREQESDSTSSPEKEEGGVEAPLPAKIRKEGGDINVHYMVGMYHNR